jgi:hypothetical protein
MHAGTAQAVGTDQLTETSALVGRRHAMRAHLKKIDRNSLPGYLPGSFTAGKAGTDDSNRCHESQSKSGLL